MSILTPRPDVSVNVNYINYMWSFGDQLLCSERDRITGFNLDGNVSGLVIEDPETVRRYENHKDSIGKTRFTSCTIYQTCVNSTKTRLVATSHKKSTLWDMTKTPPQILHEWLDNQEGYHSAHFGADDKTLFMLSRSKRRGYIHVINGDTFKEIRCIFVANCELLQMSIVENSEMAIAAIATDHLKIFLVDLVTEQKINKFKYSCVYPLEFNPKGTQLAIEHNKSIRVLDIKNDCKILFHVKDEKYGFRFPTFSQNNNIFAYTGKNNRVCHLYNTTSFQPLAVLDIPYIRAMTFVCDTLVCCGDTLDVWSPWCWKKWSDRTNYLFSSSIKKVIFNLMCVHQRLHNEDTGVPALPMQLWLNIMEHL